MDGALRCCKMKTKSKMFDLTLSAQQTLKDAIEKLEQSHTGFAFVIDKNNHLIGTITDGDLRRAFLQNAQLNDRVCNHCQRDFVWATHSTPREKIIKHLEDGLRVVPIIDKVGRLEDFACREHFTAPIEENFIARSRAPVRITFGGGGSDIYEHFKKYDGAALNATVNIFSRASLSRRKDKSINIYSHDLKEGAKFPEIQSLTEYSGNLSLITSVIKMLNPNFGFDLEVRSEAPVSSGLGGSSAVTAAVLGCFNEFKSDKLNKMELAELSYQSERLIDGVAGGWQDQYAAIFGGFNFQIYSPKRNTVLPLRLEKNTLLELEERLVLCFTHQTRSASNGAQTKKRSKTSPKNAANSIEQGQIASVMLNAISREAWSEIAKIMHESWNTKVTLNPNASNDKLDEIYNAARENGAIGGKLLGAGSGGYFLFMTEPNKRILLEAFLRSRNLGVVKFNFSKEGMTSWRVRKN